MTFDSKTWEPEDSGMFSTCREKNSNQPRIETQQNKGFSDK